MTNHSTHHQSTMSTLKSEATAIAYLPIGFASFAKWEIFNKKDGKNKEMLWRFNLF